jgi:peptide deformylase
MAGHRRPITLYGAPVLHQPCPPVTSFDAGLAALIDDMFVSMYAAEGVGLAANQVGVALRVFVYDCRDAHGVRHRGYVVNPELLPPSVFADTVSGVEGCLSIPGQHAEVRRAGVAECRGFDKHGKPVVVSGTGNLARCLQHETDHLDGRVYLDLLPEARRRDILQAARLS